MQHPQSYPIASGAVTLVALALFVSALSLWADILSGIFQ